MDREAFLDTLKKNYADAIHEAYIECEHGLEGEIDFAKFEQRIQKMAKAAKAEGITTLEFEELVISLFPGVRGKFTLPKAA